MRALIVDDEPAARSELRFLLEMIGEVEVLGEAASAKEAVELLRNIDYDLVFLDVQMPGISGIEVLENIDARDKLPAIIFVTAHGEHAVKAFELEATDYLVKPVGEDRLRKCLNRVSKKRVGVHREVSAAARGTVKLDKIFVDTAGKKVPIDLDEIFYFKAEDDYARLNIDGRSHLISLTLQELEKKLRDRNFLRVHRRFLVNIEKVLEVVPLSRSVFLLRLSDEKRTEIPVSRRRAKELREALGI